MKPTTFLVIVAILALLTLIIPAAIKEARMIQAKLAEGS